MESVAHNPQNLASMDQFFEDCKSGNLPNFAFINPLSGINVTTGIGSNDMHPDHVRFFLIWLIFLRRIWQLGNNFIKIFMKPFVRLHRGTTFCL